MRVYVDALGLSAPGLDGVAALQAHLAGAPLEIAEEWQPLQTSLPARQARRLSVSIRSAAAAAEQIDPALPSNAGWVFASSTGEGDTLHAILSALCEPEVMIQPLRFQNAVHNAAQGQWSVARGATGPATSIAAFDASVGAGLLKATMQVVLERQTVGLVCFDTPLPPPLHQKRAFEMQMAVAFALSPEPGDGSLCSLTVERTNDQASDPLETMTLDPRIIQSHNPASRAIPLLARIAAGDRGSLIMKLPGTARLRVQLGDATDA